MFNEHEEEKPEELQQADYRKSITRTRKYEAEKYSPIMKKQLIEIRENEEEQFDDSAYNRKSAVHHRDYSKENVTYFFILV